MVTYKSENLKIIMIGEHAGHKSKSGGPVRPYFTSGTLFLLFLQQTCQNITRTIEISCISLVH